ncbi:D-methionine transport system substrate-binding protein [Candidatus Phytoplasma luffae]|uniref:D-methionine transport system substrate-binding protein n=1 Tax=Loofah witches'-broom phytoplasma TaxID=35773 RepID=A0A975FJ28_LOWBP|nr:MetQ/NlpA family ABC transporter substrate-binding protein [Candidatus Phytoplasma luffae]QTX02582.1 D-methionine transport system substrate-binding protein [Candidatus Phytoplasma luffae]
MNINKVILNKIIYIVLPLLSLFLVILVLLEIRNKDVPKVVINTALPLADVFLRDVIKEELKKDNVDLESSFFDKGYTKTNENLIKDKCDAKLDCHIPWLLEELKKTNNSDSKIEVLSPFYFPKFSIYSFDSGQNPKNLEEVKEYKNNNNVLDIFIPSEKTQKNLAFRLLEQIKLIERKPENTDEKLMEDKSKLFDLNEDSFEIRDNLKIHKENFLTMFSKVKEYTKANIFINYPAVIGQGELEGDSINTIEEINKPSKDNYKDPLWAYVISLIVKKDNVNNDKIQKLKKVFSDKENLKKYWNKQTKFAYGFEDCDIKKITETINSYL